VADVQPENGYTKIANELLEVIQDFKFSQNQLKLILVVWRNTYGWNRKECELSLSYIEKTTNLDRKRANATLKSLIDGKVFIEFDKGSATRPKIIGFNKNYDEWEIPKYKNGSGETTTSCQNDTSGNTTTTTSGQNATTTSGHSATHKRNNKEILNKNVVVDSHDPGFYERTIIQKYMQLAAIGGFDISEIEKIAVRQVRKDGVPLEKALELLSECFANYKPKHSRDRINSFNYCATYILNRYFNEKEGEKYGQNNIRSFKRTSKSNTKPTTEPIFGEVVGRLPRRNQPTKIPMP